MIRKVMSLFFVMLLVFGSEALCQGASFEADMLYEMQGQPAQHSKFYMKDNVYLYDLEMYGKHLRLVVDRNQNSMVMMDFTEKSYTRMSAMDGAFFDPFMAHYYMLKQYKVRTAGKETVNGLRCQKRELIMGEEDTVVVQRAWISDKYDFPVKLINYSGSGGKNVHMKVELKNIKEVPVDSAIFKIPEGLKYMEMK